MTVVCSPFEEGLRVTVADHGRPFDPAEAARIAGRKRSQDPASGGMGLLLVRRLTDAMEYQWNQGEGNRLTLTKHK